ncbi:MULTISPECIES: hypothetical protein [unclassified Myroides]|uniref:hypothetical protein n=1 Tax=unclassified Myroides TaxID=2642485 RepID=UPI003D2F6ADC
MMDNTAFLLEKYLQKNEPLKNIERGFIFLEILDFINSLIPSKKRVLMIYTFSKIQKTFLLFKNNSNRKSEADLQEMDRLYDSLDNELKFYLSLSYLPMRAYYYYSISNFKLASYDIENCIKNANVILKGNLKLETLLKGEQILNLFKVYFRSKDFQTANSLAIELILYSVYNKEGRLLKQYDVGNIESSFYWTSHIVDAILLKYLAEDKLRDLMIQIELKSNNDDNSVFHLGFSFLKLYYEENYMEAKLCIIDLFESPVQNILPDIMLCTILSKLELILMKNNDCTFKDCQNIIHSFIKNRTQDKQHIEHVLLTMNK